MAKVRCQNCDWTGDENECAELPEDSILERVGPGETMPVGECPQCDAVCHYLDFPEGGVFYVIFGDGGRSDGYDDGRRWIDAEEAERVAAHYRKPNKWADVREIDAFTHGPAVLFVSGELADSLGAITLSRLADRVGKPVAVMPGGQQRHVGRMFWPAL